jgi:RNA polymerase-binding transcription factor DksA
MLIFQIKNSTLDRMEKETYSYCKNAIASNVRKAA